jgi:hypothetical protein
MAFKCPKGHDSTDNDYCSECGAPIGQATAPKSWATAATAVSAPPAPASAACPDCGAQRVGESRFCEVCRYDFVNKVSPAAGAAIAAEVQPPEPLATRPPEAATEPPPPSGAAPAPAPPAAAGPGPEFPETPPAKLNIAVLVDPSLAVEEEAKAACPLSAPERVFPLDLEENLVGRRSNSRGIYPEVDIDDPGVSHRHLKFIRQKDGGFSALELGSANGTQLNGAALEPGVLAPVKPGDELVLGMWSRLQVRARGN